jgi:serine/threonine protein kinase
VPPNYEPLAQFQQLYTLKEHLGEGASGIVFSGTRLSDQLEVAVKFIFKDRIPPGSGWKKDRGLGKLVPVEVFVLRRLSHKNIVKFFDVYEDATVSTLFI